MSADFLLLLNDDGGEFPPPPTDIFRITDSGELRELDNDDDRIID